MPFQKKHGHSVNGRTREYRSWLSMRDRCLRKKSTGFKNWGGRGITICERWDDFNNFFEDMGRRPIGQSLDRIDNNLGYSKSNCRWATHAEQHSNTRDNVWIVTNQGLKTLKQCAEAIGKNYSTIQYRIKRGWSVAKALEGRL